MIKIVFFCGSLQVGRDGVGDYCRRLAVELVRTGHSVGIVALNDQHINEAFGGFQDSGGMKLPVLRLPSHWSLTQRMKAIRPWVDDFDPAWLSLQFVPFAFHPKGLPIGMGNLLSSLGTGRRWHIMVHELWVGMDKQSPLKFVCWGWLQKQLIRSLFTKLSPAVIHTQTDLYVQMLKRLAFKAKLLPLFGNIPVTGAPCVTNKYGSTCNDESISFVVFGGIHPGAPITSLAQELKMYGLKNGKKIVLKMIGRCGPEQARWEQEWKAADLSLELFGEQSAERISEVLSNSSFGISTTPALLVEKSGSVAAMREHGRQVLCVSRQWEPRGISHLQPSFGVTQYQEGSIQKFILGNHSSGPVNDIAGVAIQFVNNLLSTEKHGKF